MKRSPRNTPSGTPGGKPLRGGSAPPKPSAPLIEASSVLEFFSRPGASAPPVGAMLKEFTSRVMMLFEVGTESGAEFSSYWDAMIDVRCPDIAPQLRGLGSLFDFIAQRVHVYESANEVQRMNQLNMNKAEQQRIKSVEQITSMLTHVQRTLDGILASETTTGNPVVHSALSQVLGQLQSTSDNQLATIGVRPTALDSAMSKTRDGIMSAAQSHSPRRGAPPRSPRSAAPEVNGEIAGTKPRNESPSSRGGERRPSPSRRSERGSSPSRQPHPSLPALGNARAVKPQTACIDLGLKPFVSPFCLPAKFDVHSFEIMASERKRHRNWLRTQSLSTPKVPAPPLTARPAAAHEVMDLGVQQSASFSLSKDDREVMRRLQQIRDEVLGPENTNVKFVGPKAGRPPAA